MKRPSDQAGRHADLASSQGNPTPKGMPRICSPTPAYPLENQGNSLHYSKKVREMILSKVGGNSPNLNHNYSPVPIHTVYVNLGTCVSDEHQWASTQTLRNTFQLLLNLPLFLPHFPKRG